MEDLDTLVIRSALQRWQDGEERRTAYFGPQARMDLGFAEIVAARNGIPLHPQTPVAAAKDSDAGAGHDAPRGTA